jgi:folylpolyglutamate synthase/dihydropteroate synthase
MSAPLIEAFAPPRRLEVEKKRGGYACRYRVVARRDGHVGAWRDGRVQARRDGISPAHEYRFRVTQRGRHQTRNAAMAVAAVDVLRQRGWSIGDSAIRAGIRAMAIPARIEVLPGRPRVILDGGHNRAGIRVLTDYLREENIRGFTLLFGVLRDKQYPGMARMLAPLAANVVLCAPASPRALPSGELARCFPGKKCLVERDPAAALAVAKKFKRTIIGCGSIYLVGGIRAVALATLAHGARRKKHGSEKVQGPRKAL